MDEQNYRHTYRQVNPQRCLFEKAILSRRCHCSRAHRFCLADREGVSCQWQASQQRCQGLIDQFRQKANFTLGLTRIDAPLPHAKEIKVQMGGLLGLRQALQKTASPTGCIEDIDRLVEMAIEQFDTLDELPCDEIVKAILNYSMRKRR